MSDSQTSVIVETAGPSYLGWRGELLAELALARVPELVVTKLADNRRMDLGFDFLVAVPGGFCFFIQVEAFSSLALRLSDIAGVPELRWSAPADLLRRAHASHGPVFLFLFDADTDHGRYLRLDALPEPNLDQGEVVVHLPIEQSINRANLLRLVAELRAAPAA